MFYAIRTQAIAANITERQLLSFGTKAHRAGFIAKTPGTVAVLASEARKCKPAGASGNVSDKALGCTYDVQIVL